MAHLTVNLSKRLINKLHEIRDFEGQQSNGDVSMSDIIEEAVMQYYEISVSDLQFENQLELKGVSYVYAILDPTVSCSINCEGYIFDNLPVYIGKGQSDRASSHLSKTNNELLDERIELIRDSGNEPIIKIVTEDLYNAEANTIENNLIYSIGRKDLGKGPLFNLTSGTKKQELNGLVNFMDLETIKARQILIALNENRYVKNASAALGLSERTLYRKMKQYKMEKDSRTGLYKIPAN